MLTISVSIAAGCDALWSFLPPHWAPYKLMGEFAMLSVLVILNMRGVKESVTILAPIFVVFIITHVIMIGTAIFGNLSGLPMVFHGAATDFHVSVRELGYLPIFLILLRA
jgi:amino acid transporter